MKSNWIKLKWMLGQARSSLFSLTLAILLGAICSLSGIFLALLSKRLIDSAASGQAQSLIHSVWMIGILILADVGARAVTSMISAHNSARITNHIQKGIYTHLTQTRWLAFSKYHSGDILTRMTSDVDTVTSFLATVLPSTVSLGVMLAGSLITLLLLQPVFAVLALILGPVSLLLSRFYGSRLKAQYSQAQKIETGYRSFIHESMQNLVIVKAFGLEKIHTARLERFQKGRLELVSRRSRLSAASNSALMLGSWMGYLLAFGWGAANLSKGVTSFGTFAAFLQLVGQIQGPFSGLSHSLPQIISALACAERLMEISDLPVDPHRQQEIPLSPSTGIRFEDVWFGYDEKAPLLENATFQIHPGEIAALVGPSGEGKTTLLRLLLSLMQPVKGHIYFTQGLREYEASASTRKLISYVPQGNTLFSGTLADNLRLGCPTAADQELEAAARASCAWEFIESLPDGLQTVIGERGLGLSEGQAQRLAIARALLHDSPVLILDEATSALDMRTEVKILQAIHSMSPARTCLIVTHRPAALDICHKVFHLEKGRLAALHGQATISPAIEAI